ncbi:paraquat-inducible protein A [Loktanella sp. M215]|uniref:paraquat-inducible protein A n=1 Tax=Loktanella sp. M215 TaxID=2675431 RepID=UPI001F3AEE74|nr:paraquat-inducible protein A [Loktanella sp. M215]MBU2357591.1 paraquat-inducible protein A [Alphaproteobacteria bacterium]MCF7700804.1 paraquat-inducible protein A [Loktanella sp. M215]
MTIDPDALPPLDDMFACPHCDTLYMERVLPEGSRAYCRRCGVLLLTSEPRAIVRMVSFASAGVVLMVAAIAFPFLDLDVQGQHNATSVFNAIMAFSSGKGIPLAIAVALFIVVLPVVRLLALIHALGPLVRGARPHRSARVAFALTEQLRPWAMAEIFMVGVSVALVKVAGLATVTVGPAFWAFVALVVITVANDQIMNRYSIWKALDTGFNA